LTQDSPSAASFSRQSISGSISENAPGKPLPPEIVSDLKAGFALAHHAC
jgi:hypothetical protein